MIDNNNQYIIYKLTIIMRNICFLFLFIRIYVHTLNILNINERIMDKLTYNLY